MITDNCYRYCHFCKLVMHIQLELKLKSVLSDIFRTVIIRMQFTAGINEKLHIQFEE